MRTEKRREEKKIKWQSQDLNPTQISSKVHTQGHQLYDLRRCYYPHFTDEKEVREITKLSKNHIRLIKSRIQVTVTSGQLEAHTHGAILAPLLHFNRGLVEMKKLIIVSGRKQFKAGFALIPANHAFN